MLRQLQRGFRSLLRAVGRDRDVELAAGENLRLRGHPPYSATASATMAREGAGRVSARRHDDGDYLAGKKALDDGKPAEAARAFCRALELDPLSASANYGLGRAQRALGDLAAALDSMRRAVELKHDHIAALFHAGELHAELGQIEEARDCFSLALAFDPQSSAARIALARLVAANDGTDAAVAMLREAVDAGIADSAVYCNLAYWLKHGGKTEEAASAYRAAIDAFPDDPEPLVNLGLLCLAQLGDAPQAEALFRRALKIAPGLIEGQTNLGLALQEQGRFDEAFQHYRVQIGAHPEVAEFRWNRGIAHLFQGNFGAGWDDYELRKSRPDGEIHRNYTLPDWDGSPLTGRTILVYGEQGLGDEIMFASCLPQVIAQAGATIVECDARLVALFRRSFPRARTEGRVQARNCRTAYPEAEIQAAIGSLPRHLRRSAADFSPQGGYLLADPARLDRWQERLTRLGPGLKIGISWRGGTYKTRAALRSIPLTEWEPVLSIGGIQFVSLQRAGSDDERKEIESRYHVTIPAWPEALDDIEETAALVKALDIVITVDNTVAHLAGALGQRTLILLPCSPDWRYLRQGGVMPWYPESRLFRQRIAGDWRDAIREVKATLTAGNEFR